MSLEVGSSSGATVVDAAVVVVVVGFAGSSAGTCVSRGCPCVSSALSRTSLWAVGASAVMLTR